MLASVLAKFGIPFLADILSGSLEKVNHPAAEAASNSLKDVRKAILEQKITAEDLREANRHIETMEYIKSREHKTALRQINRSLRTEVMSDDPYVRRMRPTFGYLMAMTWTAQMLAIAYVIVFKTGQSGQIIAAMESMGLIWTIGLSVLGIYVYKRSEDKKIISNIKELSGES